MISADVKSSIKQQEIKDLASGCHILQIISRSSYLQNFKYNKKGVYFSFDFVWYFIHLDFVH